MKQSVGPRPKSMRPGMSREEQLKVLQQLLAVTPPSAAELEDGGDGAPSRGFLLSRDILDTTLPRAKATLAVACWVNSITTSVVTGAQVQLIVHYYQSPALAAPLPWVGGLLGFLFQLILTFGQIYTAGRSVWGYRLCLAPDAGMTALQWGQWIVYPVLIALLSLVLGAPAALWIALAATGIITWYIGVYSAKLPERLVFGQRRKG